MTNVLMISLDDLNDWTATLGGYGGVVHTPNLDRLAAQGVSFANAFAAVPLCNPSRSAVLSGWGPLTTGVFNNTQPMFELVDPAETLPALLRDAGYATVSAGKVFHSLPKAAADRAYDQVLLPQPNNGGDVAPADLVRLYESFGAGAYVGDADGMGDLRVTAAVEAFLDGYAPVADTAGLFLSVGLNHPHLPWIVPQAYFDLYPLDMIVLPERPADDFADIPGFADYFAHSDGLERVLAADELRGFVQAYLASISFADALLGRILDALEASAIAGDTVVVLWSDHGYHLGEKDTFGKFTLWEEATRAPLIVADPRATATAGTVSDQVVSLLDIFPTVLDYAGVAVALPRDGQSLRALVTTGDATGLDGVALTSIGGSHSWRTATHRYTRYADGSEELYDLAADPDEFSNLAGTPAVAALQAELAAAMDAALAAEPFRAGTPGTPQRLVAGASERVLIAGDAADTLVGGAADNLYLVDAASVRILESGGRGTDHVLATTSFTLPVHVEHLTFAPLAEGGDAGATLVGNALDNRLATNGGSSLLLGGAGDDLLEGDGGADTLLGGIGHDRLRAVIGDDALDGGAGDDTMTGGDGSDTYRLASGQDRIEETAGPGTDAIDVAAWGMAATTLEWLRDPAGVLQALVLHRVGTADRTTVVAVAGVLPIEALREGDTLTLLRTGTLPGGDAAEMLVGTAGNDRLSGLGGNDVLVGGAGRDTLQGGDGDDVLLADLGFDVLDGGAGTDRASWADAANGVRIDLSADGPVRNVEDLTGSAFADQLVGDASGNALRGGEGRDCLEGGAGADLLDGGRGVDALVGGDGRDRFVFRAIGDSTAVRATADRILDFDPGRDLLVFSGIDARPESAADDAFVRVAAPFTLPGQLRVVFGDAATYVALNLDFDAAAEMLVRLDGLLTLTELDFVL